MSKSNEDRGMLEAKEQKRLAGIGLLGSPRASTKRFAQPTQASKKKLDSDSSSSETDSENDDWKPAEYEVDAKWIRSLRNYDESDVPSSHANPWNPPIVPPEFPDEKHPLRFSPPCEISNPPRLRFGRPALGSPLDQALGQPALGDGFSSTSSPSSAVSRPSSSRCVMGNSKIQTFEYDVALLSTSGHNRAPNTCSKKSTTIGKGMALPSFQDTHDGGRSSSCTPRSARQQTTAAAAAESKSSRSVYCPTSSSMNQNHHQPRKKNLGSVLGSGAFEDPQSKLGLVDGHDSINFESEPKSQQGYSFGDHGILNYHRKSTGTRARLNSRHELNSDIFEIQGLVEDDYHSSWNRAKDSDYGLYGLCNVTQTNAPSKSLKDSRLHTGFTPVKSHPCSGFTPVKSQPSTGFTPVKSQPSTSHPSSGFTPVMSHRSCSGFTPVMSHRPCSGFTPTKSQPEACSRNPQNNDEPSFPGYYTHSGGTRQPRSTISALRQERDSDRQTSESVEENPENAKTSHTGTYLRESHQRNGFCSVLPHSNFEPRRPCPGTRPLMLRYHGVKQRDLSPPSRPDRSSVREPTAQCWPGHPLQQLGNQTDNSVLDHPYGLSLSYSPKYRELDSIGSVESKHRLNNSLPLKKTKDEPMSGYGFAVGYGNSSVHVMSEPPRSTPFGSCGIRRLQVSQDHGLDPEILRSHILLASYKEVQLEASKYSCRLNTSNTPSRSSYAHCGFEPLASHERSSSQRQTWKETLSVAPQQRCKDDNAEFCYPARVSHSQFPEEETHSRSTCTRKLWPPLPMSPLQNVQVFPSLSKNIGQYAAYAEEPNRDPVVQEHPGSIFSRDNQTPCTFSQTRASYETDILVGHAVKSVTKLQSHKPLLEAKNVTQKDACCQMAGGVGQNGVNSFDPRTAPPNPWNTNSSSKWYPKPLQSDVEDGSMKYFPSPKSKSKMKSAPVLPAPSPTLCSSFEDDFTPINRVPPKHVKESQNRVQHNIKKITSQKETTQVGSQEVTVSKSEPLAARIKEGQYRMTSQTNASKTEGKDDPPKRSTVKRRERVCSKVEVREPIKLRTVNNHKSIADNCKNTSPSLRPRSAKRRFKYKGKDLNMKAGPVENLCCIENEGRQVLETCKVDVGQVKYEHSFSRTRMPFLRSKKIISITSPSRSRKRTPDFRQMRKRSAALWTKCSQQCVKCEHNTRRGKLSPSEEVNIHKRVVDSRTMCDSAHLPIGKITRKSPQCIKPRPPSHPRSYLQHFLVRSGALKENEAVDHYLQRLHLKLDEQKPPLEKKRIRPCATDRHKSRLDGNFSHTQVKPKNESNIQAKTPPNLLGNRDLQAWPTSTPFAQNHQIRSRSFELDYLTQPDETVQKCHIHDGPSQQNCPPNDTFSISTHISNDSLDEGILKVPQIYTEEGDHLANTKISKESRIAISDHFMTALHKERLQRANSLHKSYSSDPNEALARQYEALRQFIDIIFRSSRNSTPRCHLHTVGSNRRVEEENDVMLKTENFQCENSWPGSESQGSKLNATGEDLILRASRATVPSPDVTIGTSRSEPTTKRKRLDSEQGPKSSACIKRIGKQSKAHSNIDKKIKSSHEQCEDPITLRASPLKPQQKQEKTSKPKRKHRNFSPEEPKLGLTMHTYPCQVEEKIARKPRLDQSLPRGFTQITPLVPPAAEENLTRPPWCSFHSRIKPRCIANSFLENYLGTVAKHGTFQGLTCFISPPQTKQPHLEITRLDEHQRKSRQPIFGSMIKTASPARPLHEFLSSRSLTYNSLIPDPHPRSLLNLESDKLKKKEALWKTVVIEHEAKLGPSIMQMLTTGIQRGKGRVPIMHAPDPQVGLCDVREGCDLEIGCPPTSTLTLDKNVNNDHPEVKEHLRGLHNFRTLVKNHQIAPILPHCEKPCHHSLSSTSASKVNIESNRASGLATSVSPFLVSKDRLSNNFGENPINADFTLQASMFDAMKKSSSDADGQIDLPKPQLSRGISEFETNRVKFNCTTTALSVSVDDQALFGHIWGTDIPPQSNFQLTKQGASNPDPGIESHQITFDIPISNEAGSDCKCDLDKICIQQDLSHPSLQTSSSTMELGQVSSSDQPASSQNFDVTQHNSSRSVTLYPWRPEANLGVEFPLRSSGGYTWKTNGPSINEIFACKCINDIQYNNNVHGGLKNFTTIACQIEPDLLEESCDASAALKQHDKDHRLGVVEYNEHTLVEPQFSSYHTMQEPKSRPESVISEWTKCYSHSQTDPNGIRVWRTLEETRNESFQLGYSSPIMDPAGIATRVRKYTNTSHSPQELEVYPESPSEDNYCFRDPLRRQLGQVIQSFTPRAGDLMVVRHRRRHRVKDNGYVSFYTRDQEAYPWNTGDFVLRLGKITIGNSWHMSSTMKLFQRTHDHFWMFVGLLERPLKSLPWVAQQMVVDKHCHFFAPRRGDVIVRLKAIESPSQLERWNSKTRINPGDILVRAFIGDLGFVKNKEEVEGHVEIYVYNGKGFGWIFMGRDDCVFKDGYDLLERGPFGLRTEIVYVYEKE